MKARISIQSPLPQVPPSEDPSQATVPVSNEIPHSRILSEVPSRDEGVALKNQISRFGEFALSIQGRQQAELIRLNARKYIEEIPFREGGNLRLSFPGLWRALRDEEDLNKHSFRVGVVYPEHVIHRNIFYFGDRRASRVVVSLTGAPITAGYLVPFFKKMQAKITDSSTAFLLLPSCSAYEAETVLYHLGRLNPRLQSIGFFTHSGGSLTLHQMQMDGCLPEVSRTFCALGWVYRHDFQTFAPEEYRPEPVKDYRLYKKQYGSEWNWHIKRGICTIGKYYFPDVLWNDSEMRAFIMQEFIDGIRLRRVTGGLGELKDWQDGNGSYARQVTALARHSGMRFLIFAGTEDGAVSEKHSREALARLSGKSLSSIPRESSWESGNLKWIPLVGASHLPMLERSDEMADAYVDFLKKE